MRGPEQRQSWRTQGIDKLKWRDIYVIPSWREWYFFELLSHWNFYVPISCKSMKPKLSWMKVSYFLIVIVRKGANRNFNCDFQSLWKGVGNFFVVVKCSNSKVYWVRKGFCVMCVMWCYSELVILEYCKGVREILLWACGK